MEAIIAIVRNEDKKLLEIKSPEELNEVLIERAKNQRAHCYLTEDLSFKTKIGQEVEFNYRWMFD